MQTGPQSSWEKAGKWYNETVGEDGHYYHRTLILPNVLRLLDFQPGQPASLLDLACGQGVLSRAIPSFVSYVGLDAAPSLLEAAKKHTTHSDRTFIRRDITKPLNLEMSPFTHATLILALQNLEHPLAAFENASHNLEPGSPFVIVMNHPCFRIPRQSSWKVDEAQKIQYRRIDRYMTSMKIPIQTHPGKKKSSSETLSFHYPLSECSRWLKEAGFVIDLIEEWCSDKVSQGGAAKMENRSRSEIPLFMAIKALKRC